MHTLETSWLCSSVNDFTCRLLPSSAARSFSSNLQFFRKVLHKSNMNCNYSTDQNTMCSTYHGLLCVSFSFSSWFKTPSTMYTGISEIVIFYIFA